MLLFAELSSRLRTSTNGIWRDNAEPSSAEGVSWFDAGLEIIVQFYDAFKRAQQFPKGKQLINTTELIKDIVSFVVDVGLCERI